MSKDISFSIWNLLLLKMPFRLLKMTERINLADKAVARLKRTDSNFQSATSGKMLLNSITCHRELISERKSQSIPQTALLS